MPNYLLQYDLDTVYIQNNGYHRSTVYRHLAGELSQRGWIRHQRSCWRSNGKTALQAQNDADDIADDLENQYGVGVFGRLEYERHLNFIQVRP